MKQNLFISAISFLLIFAIVYIYNYRKLLSEQPIFKDGKIINDNFTSLPISTAWIPALFWAVIIFALVFLVLYLYNKS